MLNKSIHGYTIKRLIGSGGMADVYYAENSLGLRAAIKVLKKEYSHHTQVQDRFVHEAKIMNTLDHPNIRRVMDMGEIDGQAAIIMEHLEGQSLKEAMQTGKKLTDSTLQKYFDQCAQALIYTHSKKIIHRDIKPSNIFITSTDEVKLLDFGIAKSELTLSKTMTGQTLGTVIYMSPEQVIDPKRITGKSDLYSLGVTFYHALIGRAPYDETTGSEYTIQNKIVNEDLDLTKVPVHWKGILSGCLRKKPEDRLLLKAENFTDSITVIDDPNPSKSKPQARPNYSPTSVSKWLYYILGGVLLSISAIIGIRSCDGGATNLVVYEEGNMYGYKNATGEVFIPARYEMASPFSDGRGKVSIADSVYYIDERGSIVEVIKPKAEIPSQVPKPDYAASKDEAAWRQAKTSNTKASYEKFIRDFPNGRYLSEARIKIRDIEAEERKKQEQATIAKPYIKMISIPGRNFKLSETEVTIGQYLAFCRATNSHWPEWLEKGNKYNIYTGSDSYYAKVGMSENNANHPITGVSALDVDAFCAWMGGRLPSEAEWEYAAKGGERYEYAGSYKLDEAGWYKGNSAGKVHRVRQKKANGYGLYDLSGNVWEWTSSKEGSLRVFRGGGWAYGAGGCRVSNRSYGSPSIRSYDLGFRLAVSQ